jgi:integrase
MSAQLRLVRPRHKNRSVLVRPPNDELRSREYLTVAEVERLMKAAQHGRYGHRDATLILVAFRHGLRAAEICDLEWSQVEFGRSASMHVRRVKNGKPSVHPLRGDDQGTPGAAPAIPRQWLRISDRAGRPVHTRRRQSADKAHWRACRLCLPGSLPHAQACLRLRPSECRA